MTRDATDTEWAEYIAAVKALIACPVVSEKRRPTLEQANKLGAALCRDDFNGIEIAAHQLGAILAAATESPGVYWMEQLLKKAEQISSASKRSGIGSMTIEEVLLAAQALAPILEQTGAIPQSMQEARAALSVGKRTTTRKPDEESN